MSGIPAGVRELRILPVAIGLRLAFTLASAALILPRWVGVDLRTAHPAETLSHNPASFLYGDVSLIRREAEWGGSAGDDRSTMRIASLTCGHPMR